MTFGEAKSIKPNKSFQTVFFDEALDVVIDQVFHHQSWWDYCY